MRGDPAYSFRLWAGGAALVLAILAEVAAIVITIRPRAGSLMMLISGMLGFVCINLYYIDTFYMLGVSLLFIIFPYYSAIWLDVVATVLFFDAFISMVIAQIYRYLRVSTPMQRQQTNGWCIAWR